MLEIIEEKVMEILYYNLLGQIEQNTGSDVFYINKWGYIYNLNEERLKLIY